MENAIAQSGCLLRALRPEWRQPNPSVPEHHRGRPWLPAKSCVIDGGLIAADRHGEPDFLALLHSRIVPVCVYVFDLLELNGRDLREQPLVQRARSTQALLGRAQSDLLRFSASFPDANALLSEDVLGAVLRASDASERTHLTGRVRAVAGRNLRPRSGRPTTGGERRSSRNRHGDGLKDAAPAEPARH